MNLSTPGLAPSGELDPRSCYQRIAWSKANNVCPGHFSARDHRFGARAPKLSFLVDFSRKVRSASHCIALEFRWPITQACLCRSMQTFHTMFRCRRKVENLGGPQIWESREAPTLNFFRENAFFRVAVRKNVFLEKKFLGGSAPPPNFFCFSKIIFLDANVFL